MAAVQLSASANEASVTLKLGGVSLRIPVFPVIFTHFTGAACARPPVSRLLPVATRKTSPFIDFVALLMIFFRGFPCGVGTGH